MLNENDVIAEVRRHLEARGWDTDSVHTRQIGIDIEAARGGEELKIEAKGATSSKRGSKRFGQPFTRDQVLSHVSRAFFTAAKLIREHPGALVGLALPGDEVHREYIDSIEGAIGTLEIGLFWVASDGEVSVEAPWTV